MTLRGINLDASNPSGSPDPSALKAANFNAVRLVNKAPAAEQYAASCKRAGLFVLDAITAESHGQLLASADLHEIRNEIDIASPSSEGVIPPDQYAQEVIAYAGSNPNRQFILGSLAAGDFSASYLRAILPVLQDPNLSNVVGFALHPYAKDLTQTRSLIAAHQQACIDVLGRDLQVFVTEWNRPAAEIPGYDWWLRTSTAGAWWFAWSDGMVPGFGLNDAQRAAFKPFSNSTSTTPAPAPKPATPPKPAIVQKLLTSVSYGYGDNPPRNGKAVRFIVNHIAVGNGSLYGWFSGRELSTHFWVGKDGTIEQYVPLEQAAYGQGIVTAGSDFPTGYPGNGPDYNRMAVSIEREGYPSEEPTAAQWRSIVALNRWLASHFKIPVDGNHIVGHYRSDHVSRSRCPSSPSLPAPAYMARLVRDVAAAP